jgi:hypothetical protein
MMTELHDGTGVVLHLDTKLYFTLNATGVAVWRTLAAGDAPTVQGVAEHLVESFEVELPTALADAAAIIDELLAEGLLETTA